MAESFFEKYESQKDSDALQRLNKVLAKDNLLQSMEPGLVNKMANMAMGPGKFTGPAKGLLKLFPKGLDTEEAFPALQKVVNALKGMGKGEQTAAFKVIKPKIMKDKMRLDDIYNNDIMNNPNASGRLGTLIGKNQEAYSKLDDYLENLVNPKKMNYGGIASMPLKYGL